MDPVDITNELAHLPTPHIMFRPHTSAGLEGWLKDLGLTQGVFGESSFGGSPHLQIYSSNRAAWGFAETQDSKPG